MDFGMPYLLEMHAIEECCALARELGLQFVELNANFPDCLLEKLDPAELHRLGRRYGLYFTLHLEEECNPFSFNSTVRTAWMTSVREALSLAYTPGVAEPCLAIRDDYNKSYGNNDRSDSYQHLFHKNLQNIIIFIKLYIK
mgnify:CR=1 FL=1